MIAQRTAHDYKADLLADLRNPDYAAGYISAAAAESPETLLLALRDLAEAQKGMTRVASEAGVNRENLYRMLSEEGNPRLSSLYAVLPVLGFKINFAPMEADVVGPSEPAPNAMGEDEQSLGRARMESSLKPSDYSASQGSIVAEALAKIGTAALARPEFAARTSIGKKTDPRITAQSSGP